VNKVREGKGAFGYNVATNSTRSRFGGCHRSNQSRPRGSAETRRSVASLMLTTEVLIAERTKDDSETAGAGARGGHGGMGM